MKDHVESLKLLREIEKEIKFNILGKSESKSLTSIKAIALKNELVSAMDSIEVVWILVLNDKEIRGESVIEGVRNRGDAKDIIKERLVLDISQEIAKLLFYPVDLLLTEVWEKHKI